MWMFSAVAGLLLTVAILAVLLAPHAFVQDAIAAEMVKASRLNDGI